MEIVESWGGQCPTFIFIFSAFTRFNDRGLKEFNIKFILL